MLLEARIVSHVTSAVTSRGAPQRRKSSPNNTRHQGRLVSRYFIPSISARLNAVKTIEHIYNEIANFIESLNVAIDTNDRSNIA